MKILFIGDIVAAPGREIVNKYLLDIKKEFSIDFVIANVENLAHGRGVTDLTLLEMQNAGIDFFTGGDHVFWQRDTEELFNKYPLIRPANYPDTVYGDGYKIVDAGTHGHVLIINIMGRTFLNERINDPFTTVSKILDETKDKNISCTLVDFHAEATSEKYVMGFYLDGKVDVLVGTHTHVPTCDQRVLPNGTMYISDVGMTGNIDSILGVKTQIIQNLYLTGLNQRFEWEDTGKIALRSVIIDTEKKTIDRVDKLL